MTYFDCEAIIFDLDGVLVDSSVVIERHWRAWAHKHQLDVTEILRLMPGRPAIETIRLVAPHLDVEQEAAQLIASEAVATDGVISLDGAAELTENLPSGSWAIATSGTRAIAQTRLRAAGLTTPIVLVTIDDVTFGKPNPEPYLLAAQRLGVPPKYCVVIEDAVVGIEAARAAGMSVIGVTTTHQPDQLTAADTVINSLADIQVMVDGLFLQLECVDVGR